TGGFARAGRTSAASERARPSPTAGRSGSAVSRAAPDQGRADGETASPDRTAADRARDRSIVGERRSATSEVFIPGTRYAAACNPPRRTILPRLPLTVKRPYVADLFERIRRRGPFTTLEIVLFVVGLSAAYVFGIR